MALANIYYRLSAEHSQLVQTMFRLLAGMPQSLYFLFALDAGDGTILESSTVCTPILCTLYGILILCDIIFALQFTLFIASFTTRFTITDAIG